jgi:CRP-like cAMP-binding protein
MHRHSETLARIKLLRQLEPKEIVRLDTQCIWRRIEAGTEILSHHDTSTDVYFVVSGTVRVVIFSVRGRDTVFRDIDAGDYFGELAAIDGRERSASVIARTNATVAKMPAAVLRDLATSHPSICYQLLESAVAQIRDLSDRINEFRTLDVRHRIYAELVRLARVKANVNEGIISPPPVHQEIADRISSRREAVTRELKVLEREGALTRRRGALVVTDMKLLEGRIEDAGAGDEA